MSSDCIAIIAHDPEKSTDLAEIEPLIGKKNVRYLGRSLLFDTLSIGLSLPKVDIAVYFGPSGSRDKFEQMIELFAKEENHRQRKIDISRIKLYQQTSPIMINTIADSFRELFDIGYKNVIMMGTHCAALNSSLVRAGFLLLKDKNIVIGPSFSGRYYIFGMSKCIPEVFAGVHWESRDFYVRLGKNIEAIGASSQEMELSYEVYSPSELNQLSGDIQFWRNVDDCDTAYHTERFLRSLS